MERQKIFEVLMKEAENDVSLMDSFYTVLFYDLVFGTEWDTAAGLC
jgi:hypothetical protein